MTIRLLTPWNNFPAGFVGEVRSPEIEDWLVKIGHATRDLGQGLLTEENELLTFGNTTFSVSDSMPAAYEAAGYSPLEFVEIGEITDTGAKDDAPITEFKT